MTHWPWSQSKETANQNDIAISFARLFSEPEGGRVLDYLRSLTLERVVGPNATDTQLYYLEGQRAIVALIGSMITRGRDSTL